MHTSILINKHSTQIHIFAGSNAQAHANDMLMLFERLSDLNDEDNKPIIVLYVDGGPDWSTQSAKSLYYYGKLWRQSNKDALILANGGAKRSRWNPIERGWAGDMIALPLTV